jgi:integrase
MKKGDGWYKRGDEKWRKRLTDEKGKRGEFIGYSDKSLSKKAYDREKDRIRQALADRARGIKPIDTSPILKVFGDWVKEGRREGGHNGQGWSDGYAENILKFAPRIMEKMKVKRLDTFRRPDFEAALGDLYPEPGTRRTMGGYVKSFLGWCVRKELIPYSPLAGWPGKKLKGTRKRRPLDIEAGELGGLCKVAPLKYALAYEFAVMSGARDNEFNFIRVSWVDWKKNIVFVPGFLGTQRVTKNGQDAVFILPREFAQRLYEYARFRLPTALLFDLSVDHKDRYFQQHREAAGIPYETPRGYLTFHGLRHTHEHYLGRTAKSLGTVLSVGRHSDLKTNMIYQDSTEALNREAVEGIYALTRGPDKPKKVNEK